MDEKKDATAPVLTEDQWLELAEAHAHLDWDSAKPDGYLNAVKSLVHAALASLQPVQRQVSDEQIDAVLLHFAWNDDELLMMGHAAIIEEQRTEFRALFTANCRSDPMNTPLPADVKVGHTTFSKGVKLGIFVDAARRWHREAFPEGYTLTDEEKAANLARLQGKVGVAPDQRNRGLLQAAKQALAALDRDAATPNANLLYEARSCLRPAIQREEAFRAASGVPGTYTGKPA
jgi:hypothetical protein